MDFLEEEVSNILFLPNTFFKNCENLTDDFELETPATYTTIEPVDNIDEIESESGDSGYDDIFHPFKQSEESHRDRDREGDGRERDLIIKYDKVPEYFINNKDWIKTTNLLCCYCHSSFVDTPFPIVLSQTKCLVHDSDNNYNAVLLGSENIKKIDPSLDDYAMLTDQPNKEVKAYKLHNIICCSRTCVGNYIRKVKDSKIFNIKEVLQMSIQVSNEITGDNIIDIPEKDLWCVMKQYCGENGETRNEYYEKNRNLEIKLQLAIKN